jgi:hypothetical protein
MNGKLIVIALGGNAIKQADERGTTDEQFHNVDITARQIAKIAKAGYRLVITHGNGPQAGALLIQQEETDSIVPAQTLAVCGAMTQGQIGWMMQNRLAYWLAQEGIEEPVCTVVTQVEVSDQDPDFQDPTKPVGPFYTRKEAERLASEKGYVVKEVKPGAEKGWRRVVPSPEPLDIVEKAGVNALLSSGAIVIASGGGRDRQGPGGLQARPGCQRRCVPDPHGRGEGLPQLPQARREIPGASQRGTSRGVPFRRPLPGGIHGPQGRSGGALRALERQGGDHHLAPPGSGGRAGEDGHPHRSLRDTAHLAAFGRQRKRALL